MCGLATPEEAANAVRNVFTMMPGYTVQKLATADYSRKPTFLKEYERIVEGMRRAGLPEI